MTFDRDNEMDFENRVIVRPSGTEPLLRVMVEGRDLALIEKLANDISEVIKEELV